jgi:ribosome-associated toxin RatA of RatAB toxin-antitoxin module
MHKVNRQALVRHNAKKMFDLVNDVKAYPEFLKWCASSHIIEQSELKMIAGLTVSLVGVKQEFITENTLIIQDKILKIILKLVKGPFEHLSGYWQFSELTEQASKIELHMDFNFKTGLMNAAFKKSFGSIAQQLVSDFVKRADYVKY